MSARARTPPYNEYRSRAVSVECGVSRLRSAERPMLLAGAGSGGDQQAAGLYPARSLETPHSTPLRRVGERRRPSHLPLVVCLAAGLFLAAAPAARADGGIAVTPARWWTAWDWDPLLLVGLAFLWWLYARGVLSAWEGAGSGRGVSRGQVAAFGGGMLTLFAALVSPLDAVSAQLSSAHMLQHMLLMLVAAPLLALGTPLPLFVWSLPGGWRKRVGTWFRRLEAPSRSFWQPAAAWTLYAATLWIWHVPALYGLALRLRPLHDLQHLAFLLASYLFWRVLLDPVSRFRLSRGAGVLYLFTTCLHASVLGVFMTLSPVAWYSTYAATAPAWGITSLEDQQLAGLVMWVPGCSLYAITAAGLFAAWLREASDLGWRRLDVEAERGTLACGSAGVREYGGGVVRGCSYRSAAGPAAEG